MKNYYIALVLLALLQVNCVINAQTKRTVHVATAGTLPTLISEEEKYQIEELTLTGELNGTDFVFINEMAGKSVTFSGERKDFHVYYYKTSGKLKSINLSGAIIVSGGSPYDYFTQPLQNRTIYYLENCIHVWLDGALWYRYTENNTIAESLFDWTILESIVLPNSVTRIEGGTFSGCNGLNSIKVESGNEKYDSRNNCNAIIETSSNTLIAGCKNTIIPNSVTSIGSYAFDNCSSLTSITIPNSVTTIGNYAFYRCSGLTSITIPNSVTSISSYAFQNCSGLTSITIPNSVTSIGWSAFNGCSGLTSINIPNSVTSIGGSAFEGCSDLTSIKVESGNQYYDSRDNCNAIIETNTNTIVVGCKNTIIPNSVTSIGYSAFYKCSGLTSITIPNNVTSISGRAFDGCSGLTSIVSQINNPFEIIENVFPSNIYSTATLTVPFGTIAVR